MNHSFAHSTLTISPWCMVICGWNAGSRCVSVYPHPVKIIRSFIDPATPVILKITANWKEEEISSFLYSNYQRHICHIFNAVFLPQRVHWTIYTQHVYDFTVKLATFCIFSHLPRIPHHYTTQTSKVQWFSGSSLHSVNPSKTSHEYTRTGVYGKCVLQQNQIVFNGLNNDFK